MGNITFSEIMDFYPSHNKSVYEDLKKDYQRGSLIPFVGAGLSAFCGYLGWSKVLEMLTEFIYSKDVKTEILKMIKDDELLPAAQAIHDNYPRMLIELQKIIDYDKIKNCDLGAWYASAAYVLPYLLQESTLMTTNFDRVLEEVYDKHHAKFGKIVSPYEPDILAQVRQSNPHCLFKLHGDIDPEIHDIEELVFTQAQYDKAYDCNGPLMRELPQWFQNKRLLFLGCSLTTDRTMEVLQQVTAKNPGIDHYAILACEPGEIGQRSIELGEWGISPIFYPMDKHEAVRVILERLLEETNPDAYEELNRHVEKYAPISKVDHRFMYDSGYIGFTGRKQELEQLQDFCQDSKMVSWWAVTGPGGMGKSRLVYEFTEARKKDGWEIVWLNRGVYGNLLQWKPPVERCILVADDVQPYLQIIGEWISSVSARRRSEKLRILLLEREGDNLNSAKWAEMMKSDAPYDDTIQSMCHRSDFLQLEPLSEDELKTIMMDFAVASGRALKDGGQTDRLLKTLQKVDGDLQRPVYALAIVDAWCNGDDPTRWDKGKILDELTTRELKFYYGRLRNLSSDRISKELCSEFENLLARSCLEQILPLEEIEEKEYQKLRKRADKLEMDFFELLRVMGVVHQGKVYVVEKDEDETGTQKVQEKFVEAVVLDCPDLVKEYLVLRQAFDKGCMELMLPNDWENNPNQLRFFHRILLDYPEKLEGKIQFWEGFFAGNPKSDFCAWMYSDLVVGITVQLPKLGERAIKRLEELNNQFQLNENIAVAYAQGLFNLTLKQPLGECEQSVIKLAALHGQYGSNEEVAVAYAQGLYNLTLEQPLEEYERSVIKLAALHKQYGGNEEVAVLYAQGLYNLALEQPLEECERSVIKLAALHEQYGGNEEVAVLYAGGLVSLTIEQSLGDCEQSVIKLTALHEQYRSNEKVAVAYAQGLVNLTAKQPLKECEQSVIKLAALHEQYESNEEAAVLYAQGLYNLTLKQPLEECGQNVLKLSALHKQYESNEEVAVLYAGGLASLTIEQPLGECEQSVIKLADLHEQYRSNEEVAVAYAQGLNSLIVIQPLEEREQSVIKLAVLHEQYGSNEEVVAAYAVSLVNLSNIQNTEESVCETLQKSREILEQYPQNIAIQCSYAQTWFNLTLVQSPEALHQTVLELREFLLRHREANKEFQITLNEYLDEHPNHTERYLPLRVET